MQDALQGSCARRTPGCSLTPGREATPVVRYSRRWVPACGIISNGRFGRPTLPTTAVTIIASTRPAARRHQSARHVSAARHAGSGLRRHFGGYQVGAGQRVRFAVLPRRGRPRPKLANPSRQPRPAPARPRPRRKGTGRAGPPDAAPMAAMELPAVPASRYTSEVAERPRLAHQLHPPKDARPPTEPG